MNNNVIWKVKYIATYADLENLELFFSNFTDDTSSYEIESSTVDSKPDDLWCIEGYFSSKPSLELINTKLSEFISQHDMRPQKQELVLESLEDIDWVQRIHDNFKPIYLGSFVITNLTCQKECDKGFQKIIIEASRAFGTGEHQTTKGCISAMEELKSISPNAILDVGTGTGILAIAAKQLWPDSYILGTDIDSIAIDIAKYHSDLNNTEIDFDICDGMPNIKDKYQKVDLVISNILSTPLINLAEEFANILSDKGYIILSGFLDYQLPDVLKAYIAVGCTPISIINNDKWITLSLKLAGTKK